MVVSINRLVFIHKMYKMAEPIHPDTLAIIRAMDLRFDRMERRFDQILDKLDNLTAKVLDNVQVPIAALSLDDSSKIVEQITTLAKSFDGFKSCVFAGKVAYIKYQGMINTHNASVKLPKNCGGYDILVSMF